MDPSDVICLSDDESPFDRNQRLIKEHHEEEDRRRVQDHLSWVLEEVIEGKRKTIRIAARPEFLNIPIATPLDPSLEVTVPFEPGEPKFNIMSQESNTGSVSPAPLVEAKGVPFGALLYQSTITNLNQISAILKKHGLKVSSDIPVREPPSFEHSCHAPRGTGKLQYAAWSQEHLRTGVILPLRPYFKDYLNHMQIAPFQFQPNGYRI